MAQTWKSVSQAKKGKFSKKPLEMDKLQQSIPAKIAPASDPPGPSCSTTKNLAFRLIINVTGLKNFSVDKTEKGIKIYAMNTDRGTYNVPSFVDIGTIDWKTEKGHLTLNGYRK
uniref:Uncharacterized protein n=1 Tax=Meloidogyne enterolobii TaxID=390850 RepID=A0A6V7V1G3_MELEN|nr:unnamed protein product [Meloidogyne enterolobii]